MAPDEKATTEVTVAPVKPIKAQDSRATAKEVYRLILKGVKDLKMNEDKKKSRITFSNAHRVAAVELRKHFVLIHLPKREKLTERITKLAKQVGDDTIEVDHIGAFELSYDSRTWSYIRVSRPEEVDAALEVIEFAKTHN